MQFILAGASAVQVGTATLDRFGIFNEINLGILSYLESKGYRRLADMVGASHARPKAVAPGVYP